MKNDLPQAGAFTRLDDCSEQMAFEFADAFRESRSGRLDQPATLHEGYFVSARSFQTCNGLTYMLKLWQDRHTGHVLSYRLERSAPMST